MGPGQRQRVGGDHDFVMNGGPSGFAGKLDQLDQVLEVAFVDLSWQTIALHADRCGSAHYLTHHAAGLHDPHGTECLMSHADAASGHEEVFDVA